MVEIVTLRNAVFKKSQGAPGKSLSVDFSGMAGSADDGELYQNPGVYSKPVDGVTGVKLSFMGLNIVIATHDYNFDNDIDAGETIIYSVDSAGAILSSAKCDASGAFTINDGANSAVSYLALDTALQLLVVNINANYTAIAAAIGNLGGTYVPVPATLDISTAESDTVLIP